MSLVYFILWVILIGRITYEMLIAGALLSICLDLLVTKFLRINFTGSALLKSIKIIPDVMFFLIILIAEITKAAISVTKIILASEIQIEPCMVRFTTTLKTSAARTALANSINLTPGQI